MTLTSLPVESIADTAFLTAAYRALEGDRPDALFQDPYAQILAGDRGQKLIEAMPGGATGASGCAVRTAVMDELILRTIQEENIDTVISLGAGLDTRPYRLPLPSSLCWSEWDLPLVLDYKAEKLAGIQPQCLLKSIPLDVTDSTRQIVFQCIGITAKQVLVLTEGLLIYMTTEQVAALATDLYAQSGFHWWLTDLASPHALRYFQNSINNTVTASQATLQFAPEAGTEFFEPYGWRAVEWRSLLEAAQHWHREIVSPSLLAQFKTPEDWKIWRQMSRFVLLKRH